MRKVDNNLVFSPSDLITFMDSVYDSWMERCYVEFPDEFQVDEEDESVAILQDHGNRHELAFLAKLKQECADVVEITGRDEAAELSTIAAMQAGRAVIYQGVLAAGEFAGRSDFLVRVPGKSKLGDYHYEVWDTKLSKKAKPYFVVQLCCYAEMLERIQDRCPDSLKIVLGDGQEMSFPSRDYIHFYFQLKRSFLEFQSKFSKEFPPDDLVAGTYSRWKSAAESMLEERDDLSRVANIRKAQIEKLKKSGINTLTTLSASRHSSGSIGESTFNTLREQASLQISTVREDEVAYKLLAPVPGKGLSLLPPASQNDVFFDMEGYPHVEGGLEYLFGVVAKNDDSLAFRDWWAHDREQEKKAFESFIDYVYAKWTSDRTMHVYHYAPYEVSAVRRLAGRHSTREEEVNSLLRNEIFVDLYQIVRQSMLVGVPSYSIKYIEQLYRPKRSGAVSKATDSVVFYEKWLQNPDGDSFANSQLLNEIRVYNEADCVSTEQLAQWLWQRQKEQNVVYTGKVSAEPIDRPKASAAVLADELKADAQNISDAHTKRVQELLAHLLEFHKREDRPLYFRMFDRQKKTADELYDDIDCLAGLRRTKAAPVKVKRSLAFQYSFDPDQDTKIGADSKCLFAHDLKSARHTHFDSDKGLISIVRSEGTDPLPELISLIPDERTQTQTLADAIFHVVLEWSETKTLPSALSHLLFRDEPRIAGRKAGAPLVTSSDVREITAAIANMERTTLCIQGPPGCGKTYVGTEAIIALLKQGKKVGIASNSHKAIENLLERVVDCAAATNTPIFAAKIGKSERGEVERADIDFFETATMFFDHEDSVKFNLVAGTAWIFSRPEAIGRFDYLFIDEAGQVCLANVVAMSRCTENIVLLGDQLQLEQPVEGSHPGDSGKSSLEYLLQDHATVPANLGIFLDTTYRMHPDVCDVISHSVYESRIHAHPQTQKQIIIFPTTAVAERVGKSAGIIFKPVEHSGNTQASDEEVARIRELVADLLQCQYCDKDGLIRDVTVNDILLVAPYNMQVRKLARCIPGVQVASVDKFQGREAPIVILSMCASDGTSSPRGMDFLFSMNRLNVAISRAQALAIVVAHPGLLQTNCTTLKQMRLLNFFCRIATMGLDGTISGVTNSSTASVL